MSDLSPEAHAIFRKAVLAKRAGQLDVTEAAYREWMALDPRDPRPAYGLALMLLARGEYEEGFRLYDARGYFPETGVVMPVYRPRALPLPPEAAKWASQTVDLKTVAPLLLHEKDQDAAGAAGAAG